MCNTSDRECVRRFVDLHDQSGFEQLYQRYYGLVFRRCLTSVNGNRGLAEEAAQTTFILFAQKARRLSKRPSLAGWFYRTAGFSALNTVRQEIRYADRIKRYTMLTDTGPISFRSGTEHAYAYAELHRAVDALPAWLRDVVVEYYFLGYTLQEVAHLHAVSKQYVHKQIRTAHTRLKRSLKRAKGEILPLAALLAAFARQADAAGRETPPRFTPRPSDSSGVLRLINHALRRTTCARMAVKVAVVMVFGAAFASWLLLVSWSSPDTKADVTPAVLFADDFEEGLSHWTVYRGAPQPGGWLPAASTGSAARARCVFPRTPFSGKALRLGRTGDGDSWTGLRLNGIELPDSYTVEFMLSRRPGDATPRSTFVEVPVDVRAIRKCEILEYGPVTAPRTEEAWERCRITFDWSTNSAGALTADVRLYRGRTDPLGFVLRERIALPTKHFVFCALGEWLLDDVCITVGATP